MSTIRLVAPDRVAAGIDASRRVAWAKYYDEREWAELLEAGVEDLVDAVLYGRRFEAFAIAYQLWYVLHDEDHQPR